MKLTGKEKTDFEAGLIAAYGLYAVIFVVLALGSWLVGANVFAVIGLFAVLYGLFWCFAYAYKDATGRTLAEDANKYSKR